jgi:hypothetical protein
MGDDLDTRRPSEFEPLGHAPLGPSASTKPPGWVVIYLVACAVLTVIGLVVLYLEHRMLGASSPL